MKKQTTHVSLVSGIYYYIALAILVFSLVTVTYWQVQTDKTSVELTEFSINISESNRSFYIPIFFCNRNIQEFQIERYYFNTQERIYYSVPSATFLTSQERKSDGCFATNLSAFAGSLEPGQYEYRVFISYDINPIQKIRRQVALVNVTVE